MVHTNRHDHVLGRWNESRRGGCPRQYRHLSFVHIPLCYNLIIHYLLHRYWHPGNQRCCPSNLLRHPRSPGHLGHAVVDSVQIDVPDLIDLRRQTVHDYRARYYPSGIPWSLHWRGNWRCHTGDRKGWSAIPAKFLHVRDGFSHFGWRLMLCFFFLFSFRQLAAAMSADGTVQYSVGFAEKNQRQAPSPTPTGTIPRTTIGPSSTSTSTANNSGTKTIPIHSLPTLGLMLVCIAAMIFL